MAEKAAFVAISCESIRVSNEPSQNGVIERGCTGMKYTLGQAAKAVGKAKGTISNAIKSGRLSASKNDKGQYEIDPSELHRVYPLNDTTRRLAVQLNDTAPPDSPPLNTVETDLLRERIEELKADLEREREHTAEWRKQAQTLALTQDKPAASDARSGIIGRLFGKG